MKVVITGGNGQLAHDLKKEVPGEFEVLPLSHQELDITFRDDLLKKLSQIKPDVIINTAAFHKTDLCEEEVEKTFKVNVEGVKNLVDYCGGENCILIHVSTDYVFDGGKIETKEPYNEEDIPNPLNVYGISKLSSEFIVRNYLEKFYIVRIASVFGKAGASGKGGNFVYTILNKAKNGELLKVVNDIWMSPTYTKDAARGIWTLLTEDHPSGIYHMTNAGYCTWYEFAKKIVELSPYNAEIIPVDHTTFPTKAKRPLWSPLTTLSEIRLRSWEEAIEEFVKDI